MKYLYVFLSFIFLIGCTQQNIPTTIVVTPTTSSDNYETIWYEMADLSTEFMDTAEKISNMNDIDDYSFYIEVLSRIRDKIEVLEVPDKLSTAKYYELIWMDSIKELFLLYETSTNQKELEAMHSFGSEFYEKFTTEMDNNQYQ